MTSLQSNPGATSPLLEASEVIVEFDHRRRAVDGASLRLHPGETLGLVGESGCGKSTLCRVIVGLQAATSGGVTFDGHDLLRLRGSRLREVRRGIQMVFQDPTGSLNPRMRVGDIVAEPLVVHGLPWKDRVGPLLEECGLSPDAASRYPHEFSGGQRQRIAIARAVALRPKLLICDEPTSALDVSVQAQILNLLRDLQGSLGMAILFITHDMGVVAHVADRIAVMQQGRIVEEGKAVPMLTSPSHPCTRTLLAATLAAGR